MKWRTGWKMSVVMLAGVMYLSACTTSGESSPYPAPTSEPSQDQSETDNSVESGDVSEETGDGVIALVGPEEIVFDWTDDACEPFDIPDLPARAFRDSTGQVHLLSSHLVWRDYVGPDLNEVSHRCDVLMESSLDPDPAMFNDSEWAAGVYTEDGQTIYVITHNEYHGWEHGLCPPESHFACWYNALTLAVSTDGGQTFTEAAPPPGHFVAGLPHPFVAEAGPYGIMEPSSIVKGPDDYYYQFIRIDEINSDEQRVCLMRTDDLSQPGSWRAWDGSGFNMTFVNPYLEPDAPVEDHSCAAVAVNELGILNQSLTYNRLLGRYVLLGASADNIDGREVWGVYYAFSEDLINWTHRQLLWEVELPWTWQPGDEDYILYPTLLDPASKSLSFDTTGKTAYLYFTRFNASQGGSNLDRDLVRVPVEVFIVPKEARAADAQTTLDVGVDSAAQDRVVVSGTLSSLGGVPLANKTIDIVATRQEGRGDYFEYQTTGRIPDAATRVILGYRANIECGECAGDVDFSLYELRFTTGDNPTNLVPNPDVARGLGSTGFWMGAGAARIEPSDRGEGNMLSVTAAADTPSAADLASFSVTGGESFTATFAARIDSSSIGGGYFIAVFLDNAGEIIRQQIWYHMPAISIGNALTDETGGFSFEWAEPADNTIIEAIFAGDDYYHPAAGNVTITIQ